MASPIGYICNRYFWKIVEVNSASRLIKLVRSSAAGDTAESPVNGSPVSARSKFMREKNYLEPEDPRTVSVLKTLILRDVTIPITIRWCDEFALTSRNIGESSRYAVKAAGSRSSFTRGVRWKDTRGFRKN